MAACIRSFITSDAFLPFCIFSSIHAASFNPIVKDFATVNDPFGLPMPNRLETMSTVMISFHNWWIVCNSFFNSTALYLLVASITVHNCFPQTHFQPFCFKCIIFSIVASQYLHSFPMSFIIEPLKEKHTFLVLFRIQLS
ncbi:MAG: hypothetical protein [Circular genetic element sp.]|nr:MAG: hypothetical protein [Circular genetic element sp.]